MTNCGYKCKLIQQAFWGVGLDADVGGLERVGLGADAGCLGEVVLAADVGSVDGVGLAADVGGLDGVGLAVGGDVARRPAGLRVCPSTSMRLYL